MTESAFTPRLSVVIPCYRSPQTLESVVDELIDRYGGSGGVEIVLVNDSGPQEPASRTWAMIEGLANRYAGRVVGIDLALNCGEHGAVMAGLGQATGRYVAVMDDDGQNPPSEVGKLLAGFGPRGDDVDVVYGTYARKRHHWFRNLGSRGVSRLAEHLVGQPKGLYLCSFKAMARPLVDRIIRYPGSFPYIDGLVFRNTRRFAVVEVEHRQREEGQSGYSLAKLVRLTFDMAFGFSVLPLRMVALFGVAVSGAATVAALVFIAEYLLRGKTVEGWTSLAVLVAFLGGVTLFSLGTLGEYLGRLYLTVTGRPSHIINRVLRLEAGERGGR